MKELYETDSLSVRLYDMSVPEDDVDFYLRQARRTGGPVLELGAGTGRVAIRIAKAGFRVTGLDLSPYMLEAARVKPGAGLVRWVRGDMTRFDLKRKFRLILIPFRAFQHLLTPEAQRACLSCVRRHLAKGGRFVVDLFDPRLDFCFPGAGHVFRAKLRHPKTGRVFHMRTADRRNDPLTQTFTERFIFEESGGRRHSELLRLRWTYRYEMRYLLELCGFKVLACYGDFKGGGPRYGKEQIWVASR
ncbi:MAG: class I SAM-dependent methyltransferase [Elusimicrobiota bacterium]